MNWLPFLYVLVPVIVAIILNLIIFNLEWNNNSQETSPLLPPGWMIGVIWVIILGILGYALYLTVGLKDTVSSVLIVLLILACLAYPFYTSGLTMNSSAKLGNILTLIASYIVAISVARRSPSVFPYMIPILIWGSYVNVSDAISP